MSDAVDALAKALRGSVTPGQVAALTVSGTYQGCVFGIGSLVRDPKIRGFVVEYYFRAKPSHVSLGATSMKSYSNVASMVHILCPSGGN